MPIPAPVGRWARWALFRHSQRPWPMVESSRRHACSPCRRCSSGCRHRPMAIPASVRQPPAHLVNGRDSVVGEHLVRSASEAGAVRGVGVGLGCCYSLDVEAERDPLVERSGRAQAKRLDGVELSIHQEADRLELLGWAQMCLVQGDHDVLSPFGQLHPPRRLDEVPGSVLRLHRRADYRPNDQRSCRSRKPVMHLPASQGTRTARYRIPVGICELRAGRTKQMLTDRGS